MDFWACTDGQSVIGRRLSIDGTAISVSGAVVIILGNTVMPGVARSRGDVSRA